MNERTVKPCISDFYAQSNSLVWVGCEKLKKSKLEQMDVGKPGLLAGWVTFIFFSVIDIFRHFFIFLMSFLYCQENMFKCTKIVFLIAEHCVKHSFAGQNTQKY